MRVRKAVIPVAGLGTRFLPATKASPKEMLAIVDKPALQYIVEEASRSGIESICMVTNRGKVAIENHFDHNIELELSLEKRGKDRALRQIREINDLAEIFYVRQNETKGLGHAILTAKNFVGNEPFAILLGDDLVYNPDRPAIGQLIEVYEEHGASVVGCQTVPHMEISKYGSLEGEQISDRLWLAKSMVEKPQPDEAPSDMAVLGRHVLDPDIFDYLENTEPGYGGEIQLTDALCAMARDKKVLAYDFEGRRYDIGDKEGFLEATVEYALRDPNLSESFEKYLRKRLG